MEGRKLNLKINILFNHLQKRMSFLTYFGRLEKKILIGTPSLVLYSFSPNIQKCDLSLECKRLFINKYAEF